MHSVGSISYGPGSDTRDTSIPYTSKPRLQSLHLADSRIQSSRLWLRQPWFQKREKGYRYRYGNTASGDVPHEFDALQGTDRGDKCSLTPYQTSQLWSAVHICARTILETPTTTPCSLPLHHSISFLIHQGILPNGSASVHGDDKR